MISPKEIDSTFEMLDILIDDIKNYNTKIYQLQVDNNNYQNIIELKNKEINYLNDKYSDTINDLTRKVNELTNQLVEINNNLITSIDNSESKAKYTNADVELRLLKFHSETLERDNKLLMTEIEKLRLEVSKMKKSF